VLIEEKLTAAKNKLLAAYVENPVILTT